VFGGDRHGEGKTGRDETCKTRMMEDYAESHAAAILE
jgi:hypothetical protein